MSKMYKIDTSDQGMPSRWEWQCTDCVFKSPHVTTVKRHVESRHIISEGYDCPECSHHVPTWNALRIHQKRNHPF